MTSTSPTWLQVQVRVEAEHADAAESTLFDAGASAVTLLDAEDHPVHEPAPGEIPLWPDVIVQGLFEADPERDAIVRALIAAGLVDNPTAISFEPLADQDWERAWMDDYQPIRFGESLWICPSHVEPDPDWPLVIRLDPGLAFGSGTHPTTAMCLEWVDRNPVEGQTVVDYGCGSGVLAIACALKGAQEVVAIDHDPQALVATLDNAERNGVGERIERLRPEDFQPGSAQLVLANILASPLVELADTLVGCCQPGGSLVLSGILAEQADGVIAAYSETCTLVDQARSGDWVRLDWKKTS